MYLPHPEGEEMKIIDVSFNEDSSNPSIIILIIILGIIYVLPKISNVEILEKLIQVLLILIILIFVILLINPTAKKSNVGYLV